MAVSYTVYSIGRNFFFLEKIENHHIIIIHQIIQKILLFSLSFYFPYLIKYVLSYTLIIISSLFTPFIELFELQFLLDAVLLSMMDGSHFDTPPIVIMGNT